MTLNKKENKENKELIIRDLKEKFSDFFDLKFNETEFRIKFMNKIEEVFDEAFYIGKKFDAEKEYNEEEEFCLETEANILEGEFDIFKMLYQESMDYAEFLEKCSNQFNKRKAINLEEFLTCTFLEKEGIYQYTINESAVMQKSFEFYIKQIYEHYNLMKKYLETHQL